jgi:hypothetical protein
MQQWAKTQYQQLLPLHLRVYWSHPKCDPQSTCVIAAGELIKCMTRDQPRSRDREEALLKILNHEGVLDSPSLYNTLALLTIHEAVQLTLQSGDESIQACLILEELKELECKLSKSPYRQPPADQAPFMQLLWLKHVGDGIGFLKMQKAQKLSAQPSGPLTALLSWRC